MPKPTLPGSMPSFVPANPQAIEQQAVGMDQTAYGLSDADFKARYPQLYQSQQTFLNNLKTQQSGAVTPQLQNLWTRSGLTGALGATGGWSLGTGTTGMANVARNLGGNQMQYQQQLMNQFNTANETFRPRTFGLSGADASQIALSNIAGQNNWNQANYAYQVQESQFAQNMAAQQSVMSANAANAQTGNILSGAGSVAALAVVAFCWLARSAYGAYDPRWKRFRYWMLAKAPRTLRKAYIRRGPQAARWLEEHARFKPMVGMLMDLATWRLHYATLP
jgi:hypothetical protein